MKKFFKLMLSLALTLSVVVPATSNVNAEEVKEGVTVSANVSYPEVDTKYQATFVVDSKKLGENVTNVQLEGGFQFLKASEDHFYIENNGNTSQINFYTAYEYEPGMYPIGGCGNTNRTDIEYAGSYVLYDMEETDGIYSVTLPLPATEYFYGYKVTYADGTSKTQVQDPMNPSTKSPLSGKDAQWSYVFVGDGANALSGQEYIYERPDTKKGTIEYGKYETPYMTDESGVNYLSVYLPAGYENGSDYNTLYLVHGGGGNEMEWSQLGAAKNIFDNLINDGQVKPTVVVMINESGIAGGFQTDKVVKKVADLVECVIPYVEANYKVKADPSARALSGLSQGSIVSTAVMEFHPDMFQYYGLFSGTVTVEEQYFTEEVINSLKTKTIFCSAGTLDLGLVNSPSKGSFYDYYCPYLESIGVPYTLHKQNGGHDWNVWRASLTDFAKDFLWEAEVKEPTTYPEGVTVEEAENNAGYQATFVVDSNKLEGKIAKIQLGGGFQFVKGEDTPKYLEQGGNAAGIPWFTAYEYETGMYPTGSAGNKERTDLNYNGSYVLYDMENVGGVYSVTLPLPATEYFYGYYVTYVDGTTVKIEDPANKPVANGDSDPSWSYFYVGDESTALYGQENIYPATQAGTWSFVDYPAGDGTTQPLGIYLPYGYDETKEYKTLYLAHGGGGNETEWFQLGSAANIFDNLIAKGQLAPTIIVTMDNSYWKGGFTIESNAVKVTEVVEHIIPFMEEHYAVSDKAEDRAYAGLSAGGVDTAACLQVAPDEFNYYGIISASNFIDWDDELIAKMQTKTIMVGAGTVDFGLTGSMLSTDALMAKFDEAKVPYTFESLNGAHDWNTWRQGLTTFAKDYLWKNTDTSAYTEGVVVDGHHVTFTYKSDDKEIQQVQVYGGFQFNKEGDTTGYRVEDFTEGMYPVGYIYDGGNHYYNMNKVGFDTYVCEMTLPSNEYFYKYEVTYTDGTVEQIYDPANMPLANEANGHDSNWSLFYVGNAEDTSNGQEYIYARDDHKGTLTFVECTNPDGSTQPLGVYLPYGYSEDQEYPVLYLSHGGWGNEVEWFEIGSANEIFDNLIAEGLLSPTIVVTMANDPVGFSAENTVKNIIPFIEANYSVIKDASGRAAAGLSAGGTFAANCLTYFNDVFGYYGVWSPRNTVLAPVVEDGSVSMEGFDHAVYHVGVGTQDIELRQDQEVLLYETLKEAGMDVGFDYVNGEHDWFVWRNLLTIFAKDYLWDKVGETDQEAGVTVNGHDVTFTYINEGEKEIESITVAGNFQFSKPDDEAVVNGDYKNAKVYSAYEYEKGMINHTNSPVNYPLEKVANRVYSVTLPLPGNQYFYDYTITYTDGTKVTIQDPANPAPTNPNNGNSPMHSLFYVGGPDDCIEGQEYVYPRTDGKTGTVQYVTYTAFDGSTQPLGIYLPYGYDSSKTYKTIYMSHGGGGNETDWLTIGGLPNIMDNLIAEGLTKEAIIVTFNNNFYNFNYDKCNKNLRENVIPFIEANYSVSKDPQDRSFGGLSMPTFSEPIPKMITLATALEWREGFGYYLLSCVAGSQKDGELIYNQTTSKAKLFVYAGSVDMALPEALVVHEKMNEAGIEHMWEVLDGGHDWAIWRKGFTKFATEILWTNEEEIPGGNTEGGTTGGTTGGETTPTKPSTPNVGIYNNAAYVAVATIALAGAAYVAFKKKED